MSQRRRLRVAAKRAVRRAVERTGFELRRVAPPKRQGAPFYDTSPTCQIPELATLYELFFGQRSDGFFVEVGAYDGDSFSNSSCLADRGWSGLMVEPVPAFAQKCRLRHAANRSVRVIDVAVGADDGEVTLHVADALTTSDPALFETYRGIEWARDAIQDVTEIRVPRRRLDDLLVENEVRPGFDLLVVDVEGGEQAVLDGFDVDRWRPTMLIVELTDTHPDLQTQALSSRRLALAIADRGYCVVYRDQINTVFVRRDAYIGGAGSSLAAGSSSMR